MFFAVTARRPEKTGLKKKRAALRWPYPRAHGFHSGLQVLQQVIPLVEEGILGVEIGKNLKRQRTIFSYIPHLTECHLLCLQNVHKSHEANISFEHMHKLQGKLCAPLPPQIQRWFTDHPVTTQGKQTNVDKLHFSSNQNVQDTTLISYCSSMDNWKMVSSIYNELSSKNASCTEIPSRWSVLATILTEFKISSFCWALKLFS